MPETPSETIAAVTAWYRRSARDLPWRRPEFHDRFGAWGTLVSEFMLQQTPVARVVPHLTAWLDRWPTPADLAAATPADVVQQWANLGYPRRALWLHRAAVEIVARHGGSVPRDVAALQALSGIGDYTSRAVAAFAYGDRHPVVDTNTRRVLARALDGRSQPGPAARRDLEAMTALLPDDAPASVVVNAAMMELGAVVCTSRAPRCDVCPIVRACEWAAAGRPDTGDRRPRQARYEGSDRQARGLVLRMLREAAPAAVPIAAVAAAARDHAQLLRAVDSLLADGLAESVDGLLTLPR